MKSVSPCNTQVAYVMPLVWIHSCCDHTTIWLTAKLRHINTVSSTLFFQCLQTDQ